MESGHQPSVRTTAKYKSCRPDTRDETIEQTDYLLKGWFAREVDLSQYVLN